MKLSVRLIFVLLTLSVLAVTTSCKNEGPPLQVNDVASDPGAYTGSLRIVGVVNAFSKDDPTIVGIMDRKELQCTSPNCHKVMIPVKVAGKAPIRGDEILVTGAFQTKQNFGQILVAQETQVLTNHNLGGN